MSISSDILTRMKPVYILNNSLTLKYIANMETFGFVPNKSGAWAQRYFQFRFLVSLALYIFFSFLICSAYRYI